jgi:hypothetical protein
MEAQLQNTVMQLFHVLVAFASCLQDYELLAGSRAMNNVAMCGQLQNSITACVYFLAPHHLKKVDLILISALSQVVGCRAVLCCCVERREGGRGRGDSGRWEGGSVLCEHHCISPPEHQGLVFWENTGMCV